MQPPRALPRRLLALLGTQPAAAVCAFLVALTLGLAGLLVSRGRIPFTSDQAIPGLMAMAIADGAAAPVFYAGVEYGGALEPFLLSLAYRLTGPSTAVYRGMTALFLVGIVLALWLAARLSAGRRAGAVVGLFAALGPAYFYYKILTSDGAYASLTFAGAAAILAVAHVEHRFARGRPALAGIAGLGLASGVAFWVHLASLPYLAMGAAAAGSWIARRRMGAGHVALAVGAFFVGSLPWWLRNAETGFLSLRVSEASVVASERLPSRLREFVGQSLPTLLGPSSFRGPGAPPWVVALLVIAVIAVVADGVRRAARRPPQAGARVALPLLVLVASGFGAFLAAGNATPWEPRYLLPSLLGLVLLGGLFAADAMRRPGWRLVPALLPLLLALASHVRAPRLKDFQRMTSDDPRDRGILFAAAGDVLSSLSAKGVRSVYGSYWTVYRLVFLSGRTLAGAPFGRIAVDRMPETSRMAEADPAPAFVLDGADLRDMETYLEAGGFAADRTSIGGLVVFTGLPEKAVAELRAARRVPLRRRAAKIGGGTHDGGSG